MKDIDMINIERPWMNSISMVDGNKEMASRGFKLIGIKLYCMMS